MPVGHDQYNISLINIKGDLCEHGVSPLMTNSKEHKESTLKYPELLLIIIHAQCSQLAFFPFFI